jgi:hypothetical protein
VISGLKLRGGEHDLDQGILDYFLRTSGVLQDTRGVGVKFSAMLCVESTKLRDGPYLQTCGDSFLTQ